MKSRIKTLLEFPTFLFNYFLMDLKISEVETFTLIFDNGNERRIPCQYVTLPLKEESKLEQPTLALVVERDLMQNIIKSKIVLVSELPKIKDGQVENLREYLSISVDKTEKMGRVTTLSLHVQMPCRDIQIGNPFTKYSYQYMLDLCQRANIIFESKEFKWITYIEKEVEV